MRAMMITIAIKNVKVWPREHPEHQRAVNKTFQSSNKNSQEMSITYMTSNLHELTTVEAQKHQRK